MKLLITGWISVFETYLAVRQYLTLTVKIRDFLLS